MQKPDERIDGDPTTEKFGLWPSVTHTEIGTVRIDGNPVHLSDTDWHFDHGGPCLGEHNEQEFSELLGLSSDDVKALQQEGVI